MDPETFRREAHRVADWIADYLADPARVSRARAGGARRRARALPAEAPAERRILRRHLRGLREDHPARHHALEPSRVLRLLRHHRQRPRASSRSSCPPRSTSRRCCGGHRRPRPSSKRSTLRWLQRLMHLPDAFEGVIYDTASISTLHALAAARERAVPDVRERGMAGRDGLGRFRVYCSDQTHSSIDKAVILLGLGHESLRKIPTRRRLPDARRRAARRDRARIAPTASRRWPSSPRSARPRRRASIRCARSRRSAPRSGSGCTSTPPTPASPRWCPGFEHLLDGVDDAPTRSSSIRTSGCSRRST